MFSFGFWVLSLLLLLSAWPLAIVVTFLKLTFGAFRPALYDTGAENKVGGYVRVDLIAWFIFFLLGADSTCLNKYTQDRMINLRGGNEVGNDVRF